MHTDVYSPMSDELQSIVLDSARVLAVWLVHSERAGRRGGWVEERGGRTESAACFFVEPGLKLGAMPRNFWLKLKMQMPLYPPLQV
jgi:hypothetical protein